LSTSCWEALAKMSGIDSRSLSENVCVRFEHLLLFDKLLMLAAPALRGLVIPAKAGITRAE
jgi:hypothetical protein